MTYRQLLKDAVATLRDANIADPDTDAWLLFSWAYDWNRTDLLLHGDEEQSDVMAEVAFHNGLEQRAKHTPLQYITGQAPFMGMDFYVNPSVLIPRFDTEVLVEETLKNMKSYVASKEERASLQVLDVCTGSGCIAISVKKLSGCEMTAVDLSPEALEVARFNARRLLETEAERMHWIESDMFAKVEGTYDFILSNPPYIRPEVIATLDPEVKDAEPMMALDGGEDGLAFYRILAEEGRKHLKQGGKIIMEIGCDQAEAVSQLMIDNQYTDVRVVKDLAGLDRVVVATWTWR